jgi:hypothetical protein
VLENHLQRSRSRKRLLLIAALVLGIVAIFWTLTRSLPPAEITAHYVGRTNYSNGWTGYILAVTNVSTNHLSVLQPGFMSGNIGGKNYGFPPKVFLYPVMVRAGTGKWMDFVQTEKRPRRVSIYYGPPRPFVGQGSPINHLLLLLPRGTPREFLSPAHTLDLDLPPEAVRMQPAP